VSASITGERRHRLDAISFGYRADSNAAPGRRELQVSDYEGGMRLIVEVLETETSRILGTGDKASGKKDEKRFHPVTV
jgi:hypothetical protein